MICPRCHRTVRQNARFCPYCGTKIVQKPVQQSPPRRQQGWAQPQQPPMQQPRRQQGWTQPQQPPMQQPRRQQGWTQPQQPPMQQPRRQQGWTQPQGWGEKPQPQEEQKIPPNYKEVILKAYAKRKINDDKYDLTDLKEFKRKYSEFQEALSRGKIITEHEKIHIAFLFDRLHVKILRNLISADQVDEELASLLAKIDSLEHTLETLEDLPAEAEKLPNELELVEAELSGLFEATLDLKLVETEDGTYDLKEWTFSKYLKTLKIAHEKTIAFINLLKGMTNELGIDIDKSILAMEELDNYLQNVLIVEEMKLEDATEKFVKYMDNLPKIRKFVQHVAKKGLESNPNDLKLKMIKTETTKSLMKECIGKLQEAYERSKKMRKEEKDKKYVKSMKRIEPKTKKMIIKKEKDPLPQLDPLPELEELPELEPLQPFS